MKTVIATTAAPGAIGPYSQAIEANGFVFVSGQIPLDPATGAFVPGGVEEQAEQSLRNLKAVLAGAGCTLGDVVKTTVFLTDMGAFAAVNAVYAKYFEGDCPARSAVQVGALPSNVSARKVASAARRSAARNAGTVRVEKVRLKGQTLYRAQVAGLSETSARQACARMKRGACMVIAP